MNSNIAIICFSSLPWDFAYHRPQHLMSRFAHHFPILFVEPPVYGHSDVRFETTTPASNVTAVKFNIPTGLSDHEVVDVHMQRLTQLIQEFDIHQYIFWYYTPLAVTFTEGFSPLASVYDCMSEFPSPDHSTVDTHEKEIKLLQQVDIVFTAGPSLFESRKSFNHNIYCMPGSVDIDHFYRARYHNTDPSDQESIAHPRIGFSGVIDERIDMTLLKSIAMRKPEWNLVLLGPLVGLEESDLPQLPNIHFLGKKSYWELPDYIAGWDLTMLPFIHNDATRYINPMQTPEFLAAGKPVIATPIIDVIRSYGNRKLVQIAGTPEEFTRVASLHFTTRDKTEWLQNVADFLSLNSWDKTWQRMMDLILPTLRERAQQPTMKHSDKIYA